MKLYYAPGGGMGHLSRGRAFAHTMGWTADEVIFVSASPFADSILADWTHRAIPEHLADRSLDLRIWLNTLLKEVQADSLYLDTFPVGLFGEWNGPQWPDIPIHLVSRCLQWNKYVPLIRNSARFQCSYVLEPLPEEQLIFLESHSDEVQTLQLTYPNFPISQTQQADLQDLARPLWLIVHSQPKEEVEALIDMAHDQARMRNASPTLLVISQVDISESHIILRDWQDAYRFFPDVDRIFIGAGFNLAQQSRSLREKTQFLPFVRRYDDQFFRVKHLHINPSSV